MFAYRFREDAELRLLVPQHAEELFSLIETNRAYLRRWLPESDLQKTLAECQAMIKTSLEQFAQNAGMSAGIWVRGRLAGVIGLGKIDWENRSAYVGYWVGESSQGRGLVTDACRAFINYAFSELKLKRLEIRCATDNPKSCAIPRRLGFQKEGVLRQSQVLDDRCLDINVYGLLAEEWKSSTTAAAPPATRRSRRAQKGARSRETMN